MRMEDTGFLLRMITSILRTEGRERMTFKKAYEYAMEHSERFRRHDLRVKEAARKGEASPCLIFSVEPGETFYYGFDGVDMAKGRHSARRAQWLLDREEVLIIL